MLVKNEDEEVPSEWEQITIETEEGSTSALFLPALPFLSLSNEGKNETAPVVAFFHANAELAVHWCDRLRYIYGPTGVHVLAIEYRGYDECKGNPSQDAITRDSDRLIDEVVKRAEVSVVYLHGRSIGGGIAAQVASRREDVEGMIMESTFTHVAPLFPQWFPTYLIRSNPNANPDPNHLTLTLIGFRPT